MISDTNPEILEKQAEMLRNASFQKRLDIFLNLNRNSRRLAWNGIKQAKPNLTDMEVDMFFVEVHYGKEIADKLTEYFKKKEK